MWALANDEVVEHMSRTVDPSAKQWIFSMLESQDDFDTMAVTFMDHMVRNKRKIIFEGDFQIPLSTHLIPERFLKDIGMLKGSADKVPRGTTPWHPKRTAPPEGLDKLNIDTAVYNANNYGAVGVVCRSRDDSFLGTSVMIVASITDPVTLEAMACREALALPADLNLQRFAIASDCLQVINNLKDTYEGSYSMIISEIKARSKDIIDVRFKHEKIGLQMVKPIE
jgi:ribonuclease HI